MEASEFVDLDDFFKISNKLMFIMKLTQQHNKTDTGLLRWLRRSLGRVAETASSTQLLPASSQQREPIIISYVREMRLYS
jgi:hypothetical protein